MFRYYRRKKRVVLKKRKIKGKIFLRRLKYFLLKAFYGFLVPKYFPFKIHKPIERLMRSQSVGLFGRWAGVAGAGAAGGGVGGAG